MDLPSTGGEADSALLHRTAKSRTDITRHRTAPDTTADCAVPPLQHQSTGRQMVASKRNNIGEWARRTVRRWRLQFAQGMATGECAR